MSSYTYILCPGQGAQHVGMGKDFYEKFDAAKDVFDRANEVLGFDLKKICFEGPDERLNQTDVSQPAIYVTSVACFKAAMSKWGTSGFWHDWLEYREGRVGFAGLSLGEYTALHLGGVFGFEDGLRLVAARGRYMQEAATAVPSSMVAIMGAEEHQALKLCDDAAQGEVLVPANFNAPGQIVVSGSKGACERAVEVAAAMGFRAVPLVVAGAFHSPLMQPAADRMSAELETVKFHDASGSERTIFSNVTGQLHTDSRAIKSLLVDQIVKPVRWEQTMAQLANVEGNKFIELAPGKVLTGLLRKQNRRADILTLNDSSTLA